MTPHAQPDELDLADPDDAGLDLDSAPIGQELAKVIRPVDETPIERHQDVAQDQTRARGRAGLLHPDHERAPISVPARRDIIGQPHPLHRHTE